MKREAIKEFSKYAKIFITSESRLPPDLDKYRINIPTTKIHDALFFASLYFGDGGTMTSESAVLGTPSIHISPARMGYTDELSQKYDMVFNFTSPNTEWRSAISKGCEILRNNNSKILWKEKRERLLNDKIDLTKFISNYVDRICN